MYGCTDPTAENYNSIANVNDCFSCVPAIEIDFSVVNPICWDDLDGEFIFDVVGGVPPYTYSLYDNLDNSVILNELIFESSVNEVNLQAGDYVLEIIDSEGYLGSISFSILQANDFLIDIWESGGWLNTLDGYDNYEWTLDGVPLGNEFNTYQIYPTTSGIYTVTVSFEYGDQTCVSSTVYYNYELFQNSINEESNFSITCEPNPFIGNTVVNIEKANLHSLKLCLYDGLGKKIWNNDRVIVGEKILNIENLKAGMYYLYATGIEEVQIIQIMVLE